MLALCPTKDRRVVGTDQTDIRDVHDIGALRPKQREAAPIDMFIEQKCRRWNASAVDRSPSPVTAPHQATQATAPSARSP
jgi:hypothetical protein